MAPLKVPAVLGADAAASGITEMPRSPGWISSPNGRGTIDILLSCLVTIFLCSWSVLFLNIPLAGIGQFGFLLNKARWMAFTIFFPEMTTGIAAEQWRSAIQSVEDFSLLKEEWESAEEAGQQPEKWTTTQANLGRINRAPWTMWHAFLADMGGLVLNCPNFPAFPIDGSQLVWLVKNGYLDYPEVSMVEIWDKNKADGFARAVTISQIIVSSLKSAFFFNMARPRLLLFVVLDSGLRSLRTAPRPLDLELSTLAFLFCSLNTFFFWRHKPLDIETPTTLHCGIKMADIIAAAGERASKRYLRTPLDFVKPRISRASLIAPFWFAMELLFNYQRVVKHRPIKTFRNHQITPPRGIKIPDIIFALVFEASYFAIYLAGWNFFFPTKIERILWRVASITLLGLLIVYLVAVAVGTVAAGPVTKRFFNNDKAITIIEVASLLPHWVAVLLHGPFIAIYIITRSYILVEGFIYLRNMPSSAFETVNWCNFLPNY